MVLKPRQNKKDLEKKIKIDEILKEIKDDLLKEPLISVRVFFYCYLKLVLYLGFKGAVNDT